MRRIIRLLVIVILAILLLRPYRRSSNSTIPDQSATLILFWSSGCPHCEKVKEFIASNRLDQKIKISFRQLNYRQGNQNEAEAYYRRCSSLDTTQGLVVPMAFLTKTATCFLGDQAIIDQLNSMVK
jgi:glutaredoxin